MPKINSYDVVPVHPDHKVMMTNGDEFALYPVGATIRCTFQSIQDEIEDNIAATIGADLHIDGGTIVI